MGLFFGRCRDRCETHEGAFFEPAVDGVDCLALDVQLGEFIFHLRAGHALEFEVRQVAEIVDEAVFESRVERLAITLLECCTRIGKFFFEQFVGLALADKCCIAVAFAASCDENLDDLCSYPIAQREP